MNLGNSRDTIALAGWLFADLLLGLGLLFFVAESKGTAPTPTPTITRTATLTRTPTQTFTPSSTATRYPTNTPYPTFTLIHTYTPYPTFTPGPTYTPGPSYTPYPTFTPVPPEWTYTPYPTYTQPAPQATYTPYPTVLFGLNGTPYTAEFHISPSDAVGLTSSPEVRARARDQIRAQLGPQIQTCFSPFDGIAHAGVAIILGANPSPAVGNAMANEADALLREAFPRVFEGTVTKPFHFISADPAQNGHITAEIYFINESGETDLFSPEDSVCNP